MLRRSFRQAVIAALLVACPGIARSGVLKVTVRDARDGAPLAGAWVQVGPGPGTPFSGNSALTNGAGVASFDDPALSGPQTVTVAENGFARLSVMDSAVDSLAVLLHREIADSTIAGPRAAIMGTVSNLAIANNDGNLDIGIVYPAFRLRDIIRGGALPIEAPSDTVIFPILGATVLPGNVVIPTQTEALFLQFSKPGYHFFVPGGRTYDFFCLAGRLPILSLADPDPRNSMTMREIGAERQIAVSGDRALTINSDIDLTNNLTVTMPEAAPASEIQVFSLADLAEAGGVVTYFYDSKTGIGGSTPSLVLSGRNPAGDLSVSAPYVAGVYGDSSAADAWQAGRVDRSPLTLPASRTIGGFFSLPDLTQTNDRFSWSDVSRPGITPGPTWAVGVFQLAPISAGDSTVTKRTLWEVWAPASRGSFVLPSLEAGAPGGLLDPAATPEADRLTWDELLTDPSGTLQQVIEDAYSTSTRFSRRTVTVVPPVTGVPDSPVPGAAIALALPAPNPFHESTSLRFALPSGGALSARVFDSAGRLVRRLYEGRVHAGSFAIEWDGANERGERAPAGVYFVRASFEGRSVVRRVVLE